MQAIAKAEATSSGCAVYVDAATRFKKDSAGAVVVEAESTAVATEGSAEASTSASASDSGDGEPTGEVRRSHKDFLQVASGLHWPRSRIHAVKTDSARTAMCTILTTGGVPHGTQCSRTRLHRTKPC